MNQLFGHITELTKSFIKQVVKDGDYVVDATAGNGNDTIFLANIVSDNGMVFSFDIQEKAIINTKEKLIKENLHHRVKLINTGHENVSEFLNHKIKAAMFNLGYLPKSDHSITTKGDTTILALQQLLYLLLPGGIISICVYHGHPEGKNELKQVLSFVKTIDYSSYNVVKLDYYNKINNPPILILIEKK